MKIDFLIVILIFEVPILAARMRGTVRLPTFLLISKEHQLTVQEVSRQGLKT